MADDAERAAGREKTSRPRERGRRRRVAPGPDALRRLERDSTLSPGPSSGAGCASRMKGERMEIGISLDSRSRRKGLAMKKPCASARTSCGRRRRWQRGWSGTCQTSRGGTCAARARGTRRSAEPVTAGMSFVTGSPRSHAVRPGRQRMREQSHADQRDHDARPGRDAA